MKKLSPFLALATLAAAMSVAQESELTPYPIRNIPQDTEKFRRIYDTVASQLEKAELGAMELHRIEILQTIGPKRYRVKIGEKTYAMEIPIDRDLADDEVIELPVFETNEVFQYTTVLGAISTIKVAKIPQIPKRITMNQFLILLQGGQSFTIEMGIEEIRCNGCGGFGVTSGVSKTPCRKCDSIGIFKVPKRFLVHW